MRRLSLPVLFGLITVAGVFLLGRQLAALYREPTTTSVEPARFPPALAGERFHVPADAGFHRIPLNGGTLLVEGPHRNAGQARVSLCAQRARSDPASPLIPLYIGLSPASAKIWRWTSARPPRCSGAASTPSRATRTARPARRWPWSNSSICWTAIPTCWMKFGGPDRMAVGSGARRISAVVMAQRARAGDEGGRSDGRSGAAVAAVRWPST